MTHRTANSDRHRPGVIVVVAAVMMAALVGLVAFAVDYGYLLKIRTDLQRSADASALAAVRDLIRKEDGTQDLDQVRDTVRTYARNNLDDASFQVASADIQVGRYDPQSIYSQVTLLDTGTLDTVRVTLRRDGATNPSVPLFFARLLGTDQCTVAASATAVLQKAEVMSPGTEVLPFATPKSLWDSLEPGDTWSAYGNGKLKDEGGNDVPGNWGTLDIGPTDNSTDALNDQILNGLEQADLDALHSDGRIPQNTYIDSAVPAWMQGDQGLSSGLKQSVLLVEGKQKLIPIFDQLSGPIGSNVDFHVIGWGVVTVISSEWQGYVNTRVIVKKSHMFSGKLRPTGSLSSGSGYIDGAFTSPVLVE
jgi:Flp pilus assembly protein TadG